MPEIVDTEITGETGDMAVRRRTVRRQVLTVGQGSAALAIATSVRGVELVVGVAGSSTTSALAAAREAFKSEGFEVVGASTSDQAAARCAKRPLSRSPAPSPRCSAGA